LRFERILTYEPANDLHQEKGEAEKRRSLEFSQHFLATLFVLGGFVVVRVMLVGVFVLQ
jgi:hypothetical protein